MDAVALTRRAPACPCPVLVATAALLVAADEHRLALAHDAAGNDIPARAARERAAAARRTVLRQVPPSMLRRGLVLAGRIAARRAS